MDKKEKKKQRNKGRGLNSASAHSVINTDLFPSCSDPARVINMPPVIYVPRKLPGIIRCPVDANPPVTSVKWEKDGYPLRVEKVGHLCHCVEQQRV